MPPKFLETDIFAELRQKGGYYVDKTRFLEQFLYDPAKATLFTRPRRFGKSLFMLAEFFDIKKQGDRQNLFEGLAVSANEKLCQEWMHQYPVISITLKGVDFSTYSDAIKKIKDIVREICINNNELLNCSAIGSEERKDLMLLYTMESDTVTLCKALFSLTKAMNRYYGKQAILLIDEYDVPVAKAAERGYYDEMILFMRNFLSEALKSNPYLSFAILTGALRITKESIFTGLNNLTCYDIASPVYEDIFGFTQTEVDKMLADAGCEESRDIIREWYDGYHFGERTDMYCPWSITNYLRDLQKRPRKPQAYWVSTSENALTRDFAKRLPDEANVYGNFAALLAGEPIAAKLNPCMNFMDIFTSADNFWTLLYLTGYLTPTREAELPQVNKDADETLLVIPNREVRDVFQTEVKAWLRKILPENLRTALYEALWEQDAQGVERQLSAVLEGCSFHDAKEAYYHGIMYGILRMRYNGTRSNRESGLGRHDLVVPDRQNSRALVLEFKRAPSAEKLEAGVRDALRQIADRDYDADLRAEGYTSIVRAGIAFFGKSVKVGFEEVRV